MKIFSVCLATGVTTLVVHLELRTSLRIKKKFETALLVYSGAWRKLIHEKN
jgi:hypothetical protein